VYAPLFARNLPEIYIRALEAAPTPGVRTSLEHLRATWKDVFPAVRERERVAAEWQPPAAARVVCRHTSHAAGRVCKHARRAASAQPCRLAPLARSLERTLPARDTK
jgi:hypothetical protein